VKFSAKPIPKNQRFYFSAVPPRFHPRPASPNISWLVDGHCDGVLELDEAALRLIELEVESVTGAAESRPDGTAPVGQEAGQSPAPSREIDFIPDWRLPEVWHSARGDLYDDVDGISSNTEGTSRGGTR